MTLIVGAVYPWGELLKWPGFQAAAQLGIPQSAVLAADSRWTHGSGKTEDNAVKLFAIGEPCIVAYAGGVAAGEDAIAALSAKLGRTRTVEQFAVMIREILLKAWEAHPHKDDDLEILLGISATDGGAWLGHFSASEGFIPHAIEDMKIIAPATAEEHFKKLLHDGTQEVVANASRRSVSLSVETWAAILMTTVKMTCESEVERGVGGAVLGAHTTRAKAHGQGVVRVTLDAGQLHAEELSVDPLERRHLRKHWKYDPGTDARGRG